MFGRKLCTLFALGRSPLFHSSCGALFKSFKVCVSRHSPQSLMCVPLKNRHLLKVSGPDVMEYLQGMFINGVKFFDHVEKQSEPTSCSYFMLLNGRGRVLYDLLLYQISEEEFLVEYDALAKEYMQLHLEMCRFKKMVRVRPEDTKHTWVIFPSVVSNEESLHSMELITKLKNKDGIIAAFKDPRVPQLGYRIIVDNDVNVSVLLADLTLNVRHDVSYDVLRNKLGIGEGVKDHPPGNSFPLECNIDYLHGISFQVSLYTDLELTAKLHQNGVVLKRLMPVTFISEGIQDVTNCSVFNEKGTKLGKLCSNTGPYGLALLNVEESLKSENLILKDHNIEVKVNRPCWWPQDVVEKI